MSHVLLVLICAVLTAISVDDFVPMLTRRATIKEHTWWLCCVLFRFACFLLLANGLIRRLAQVCHYYWGGE